MFEEPGEQSLADALEEARRKGESNEAGRTTPGPAEVAAINDRATERYAHHKAGYLVAVFVRDGWLTDISVGSVDCYLNADSLNGPQHQCDAADQPFHTYAAMWAQAMWEFEDGDDYEDFSEAFEDVSTWFIDGCADEYWKQVAAFDRVAVALGFSRVGFGRGWEDDWDDQLEHLWPAVKEVARLLCRGSVTHADVKGAVVWCLDEHKAG